MQAGCLSPIRPMPHKLIQEFNKPKEGQDQKGEERTCREKMWGRGRGLLEGGERERQGLEREREALEGRQEKEKFRRLIVRQKEGL